MAKRRKLLVGGTRPIRPDYFFDENDVDITGGSPEPTVAPAPEPEREGPIVMTDKRFDDAFKNARISGADTFMWKGREYSTRMRGESRSSNTRTTNTRTTNTTSQTTRTNTNTTTSNSRSTNNRTVAPARRGTRTQVRPTGSSRTGSSRTSTSKSSSNNSRRTSSTPKRTTRSIATTPAKPTANTAPAPAPKPAAAPAPVRKAAPKAPSDFYEARKIAQSQGKKSFNWKGQTYSAYGATSPVTKPNPKHMKLFGR